MKLWRGQPEHDHWRKPFTAKEKAFAWCGLSVLLAVLGAFEWLSPSQNPFSGKWAWLFTWAYALGPRGPALVYFTLAGSLIVTAVRAWAKNDA